MTIGILQIQGLLIQAVGLVYQAATATPVVSSTMETSDSGGLLQIPVPTLGFVTCTTSTAMLTGTPTFATTAFLLVASGIKTLYLSNAVALCSNCVVISIQLAFSILLKSSSNSFDLRPVSSTN